MIQSQSVDPTGEYVSIYKPIQIIICDADSIDSEDKQELIDLYGVDELIKKPVSSHFMESLLHKYDIFGSVPLLQTAME